MSQWVVLVLTAIIVFDIWALIFGDRVLQRIRKGAPNPIDIPGTSAYQINELRKSFQAFQVELGKALSPALCKMNDVFLKTVNRSNVPEDVER